MSRVRQALPAAGRGGRSLHAHGRLRTTTHAGAGREVIVQVMREFIELAQRDAIGADEEVVRQHRRMATPRPIQVMISASPTGPATTSRDAWPDAPILMSAL
jgi:hypothetical protein